MKDEEIENAEQLIADWADIPPLKATITVYQLIEMKIVGGDTDTPPESFVPKVGAWLEWDNVCDFRYRNLNTNTEAVGIIYKIYEPEFKEMLFNMANNISSTGEWMLITPELDYMIVFRGWPNKDILRGTLVLLYIEGRREGLIRHFREGG